MITTTLLTFYDKYSWFPFSFGTANIITRTTKKKKKKLKLIPNSSLLSYFWCNSCSTTIIFFLVMFLASIFINLTYFDKFWPANSVIFIKFVLFNSSTLWRSPAKPLIRRNNLGMISIYFSHIGGSHHTKNLHPLPLYNTWTQNVVQWLR